MSADLTFLYSQMLKSRLFEQAIARLWRQGLISGEMHLGVGEEGIAAGIVCQLRDGDAMALDHRGTPELLMRGVDPALLLREFLGRPDGLCGGMGGHMHLFSRSHLAASSGIVGASGPAAVGFALAGTRLRPGTVAVAFFGEGAMNQGMLMEALNLAVVWRLPILFVCKDNQWAITTPSSAVTGGKLVDRARAFGMPAVEVDGGAVDRVWEIAGAALARARQRGGPTFVHARCVHLEGHFLGDPLLKVARRPVQELPITVRPLLSAARRSDMRWWRRASELVRISVLLGRASKQLSRRDDPLLRARRRLAGRRVDLAGLEGELREDMRRTVENALSSSAGIEVR